MKQQSTHYVVGLSLLKLVCVVSAGWLVDCVAPDWLFLPPNRSVYKNFQIRRNGAKKNDRKPPDCTADDDDDDVAWLTERLPCNENSNVSNRYNDGQYDDTVYLDEYQVRKPYCKSLTVNGVFILQFYKSFCPKYICKYVLEFVLLSKMTSVKVLIAVHHLLLA